MRITSPIFDAFLKCATKCHLRSLGETGSGNEYAEWVRGQDESYQREAVRRLEEAVPETERVVAPPTNENLKVAQWRLVTDLLAQTPDMGADSPVSESRPNEETHEISGPRPKQEQLLQLLRDHKSLTPREIWDALAVSKQGTLDLLRPLIQAGLVKRIGTQKTGHYILA